MKKEKSTMIGKHVIVRSNLAGVFFGILTAKEGDEITLKNARKFYYFSGANTVEDLAQFGAQNISSSKLTVAVDDLVISKFDQIIVCTPEAILQNNKIPVWTQKK